MGRQCDLAQSACTVLAAQAQLQFGDILSATVDAHTEHWCVQRVFLAGFPVQEMAQVCTHCSVEHPHSKARSMQHTMHSS